ncbi:MULTISPECIES: dienelactone hydrolase family protein [Pseudomonas]|uniref:Hydrolase n=1 Tax=Pseudomonas fluorescens TaxID=294 RepID=A0A7Z3C4K7_PSEFL|nr:dienelactone hydrolase family protein [Pseudomonas fluorescens]QJP95420.1 hydrolase [Pseudomonas fluorescens]
MPEAEFRCLDLPGVELSADLRLPENARALVIFVHGSGSGRLSPRNQYVADVLALRGLASLLFDLLTEPEQRLDNLSGVLRFDVSLLARRLIDVIDWVGRDRELCSLLIGLFGASTGAAAAMVAAAERASVVGAVVSRGGRTDLAGPALARVKAPTLQIVGAQDPMTLALNRRSSQILRCEQRMEVVEGATHLFEEPGTLEEVARLAGDWFEQHLRTT